MAAAKFCGSSKVQCRSLASIPGRLTPTSARFFMASDKLAAEAFPKVHFTCMMKTPSLFLLGMEIKGSAT